MDIKEEIAALTEIHLIGQAEPLRVRKLLKEHLDKLQAAASDEKSPPTRTYSQNRALHLWFEQLAATLNEAGFSVQKVLSHKTVEVDWSAAAIKELLWRPVQIAATGKHSTTDLDKTSDIDLIRETLNRHLSEKLGISVPPFPSYATEKDDAPLISDTMKRT